MKNFIFSYPTKVYFGEGSASQALASELGNYGGTVMLAYGSGAIKRNGVYDEVCRQLAAAKKKIVEFFGVMPNPTYAKVQEGAALARKENVDFILAVGGGSVIDCCKVISAQAMLDDDIWEMEHDKGKFPAKHIPLGAIVTVAGTGAEMNGGAVITHEAKKWKGGIFAAAPSFAVLDPAYTLSVPRAQIFSGAFDTLSHAMEIYFGNSDADNVSDELALAIMKNTVVNMRRLLKNFDDLQAHQIEHQLGAYTNCNHGMGLAIIQPVYYRHIVKDAPQKFARFALIVFGEKNAERGLDALENFIRECGLPTKLGELKSGEKISSELLRKVADTTNIIKSNPRELTRNEIYKILTECM